MHSQNQEADFAINALKGRENTKKLLTIDRCHIMPLRRLHSIIIVTICRFASCVYDLTFLWIESSAYADLILGHTLLKPSALIVAVPKSYENLFGRTDTCTQTVVIVARISWRGVGELSQPNPSSHVSKRHCRPSISGLRLFTSVGTSLRNCEAKDSAFFYISIRTLSLSFHNTHEFCGIQ